MWHCLRCLNDRCSTIPMWPYSFEEPEGNPKVSQPFKALKLKPHHWVCPFPHSHWLRASNKKTCWLDSVYVALPASKQELWLNLVWKIHCGRRRTRLLPWSWCIPAHQSEKQKQTDNCERGHTRGGWNGTMRLWIHHFNSSFSVILWWIYVFKHALSSSQPFEPLRRAHSDLNKNLVSPLPVGLV